MASPNFRRFLIYIAIVVSIIIMFFFVYQLINAQSIPIIIKTLKSVRAH